MKTYQKQILFFGVLLWGILIHGTGAQTYGNRVYGSDESSPITRAPGRLPSRSIDLLPAHQEMPAPDTYPKWVSRLLSCLVDCCCEEGEERDRRSPDGTSRFRGVDQRVSERSHLLREPTVRTSSHVRATTQRERRGLPILAGEEATRPRVASSSRELGGASRHQADQDICDTISNSSELSN